jgi:hypothetical protein
VGFGDIEAEAGSPTKKGKEFADRRKHEYACYSEAYVVGEGADVDGGVSIGVGGSYAREEVDEGVHEEIEEEGCERAALFNATGDVDEEGGGSFYRGLNRKFVEEALSEVDEPGGHTDVGEDGDKGIMGDTVKGFFEVEEEKVVSFLVEEGLVEFFVEETDVVIDPTPVDEGFLLV